MSGVEITGIDHLVLTVASIERTVAFGTQKFNLHEAGHEFEPKAASPTAGSVDVCLITRTPLDEVVAVLAEHRVPVIEGPVTRTGAQGKIRSVYVRDPDANLVEIATY